MIVSFYVSSSRRSLPYSVNVSLIVRLAFCLERSPKKRGTNPQQKQVSVQQAQRQTRRNQRQKTSQDEPKPQRRPNERQRRQRQQHENEKQNRTRQPSQSYVYLSICKLDINSFLHCEYITQHN